MRLLLLLGLLSPFLSHATPKQVLIVGQGPDGHPYGAHEFMAGTRVVEALLARWSKDATVTVANADGSWPEGPALLDKADALVMLVSQGAQWMQQDEARYAALKRLAARKGGLVALHWSVGAKDEKFIVGQLQLLGGTRGGPQRKYVIIDNDVKLVEKKHPVLRGLEDFRVEDEFYYRLNLVAPSSAFHPLLATHLDGRDETICWAWDRPEGGRSFGYVGLHFHRNWERPEYRRLVLQGILWSLGLKIPATGADVQLDSKVLVLPPKEK